MTSVIRRADAADFSPHTQALDRNNGPHENAPTLARGTVVKPQDSLVKGESKPSSASTTAATSQGHTLSGTATQTGAGPLVMAPPKPSATTTTIDGKPAVVVDSTTARAFTITSTSGKTTTLGAVVDYLNSDSAPQGTRDAVKQSLGLVETGTDATGKTVYAIALGNDNETGSNTEGRGEKDNHNTSSSSASTRSSSPEAQVTTTAKAALSAQRAMSTATNAALVNLASLNVAQSVTRAATIQSLKGSFTFGSLKRAMRSVVSADTSATSDDAFTAALSSSMDIESLLYLFMSYASEKYDDELRDKMQEWEEADAAEEAEENTRSIANTAAGVLSLVPGVGSALSSTVTAAASTYASTTTDSQKSSTVLMQEVQILVQQWQTVNSLVSNLSKDLNDMAMTSIRNLR